MTRLTIDELEVLTPDQLWELLIAEVKKNSPDVQFIQDLIAVGCPIDARDDQDHTALHWAAWREEIEVVKFLVSRGADLEVGNYRGRTAWDIADNRTKDLCPELKP